MALKHDAYTFHAVHGASWLQVMGCCQKAYLLVISLVYTESDNAAPDVRVPVQK